MANMPIGTRSLRMRMICMHTCTYVYIFISILVFMHIYFHLSLAQDNPLQFVSTTQFFRTAICHRRTSPQSQSAVTYLLHKIGNHMANTPIGTRFSCRRQEARTYLLGRASAAPREHGQKNIFIYIYIFIYSYIYVYLSISLSLSIYIYIYILILYAKLYS